jgi:hypothetical protein
MFRLADLLPPDDGPYEYRGGFAADAGPFSLALWERVGVRVPEPARWYDPSLGVWLSEDVVGFSEAVKNGACNVIICTLS